MSDLGPPLEPFPDPVPVPQSEAVLPPVRPDLDVPWGFAELGFFVLFAVLTLLSIEIAVEIVLIVVYHVKHADILQYMTSNTALVSMQQLVWSALLIGYLAVLIRRRFGRPFWSTVGWRPLKPVKISRAAAHLMCLFTGPALVAVVQIASVRIARKGPLPIEAFFRTRSSVLWLMALAVVVAPVVEETVFRGFIYPAVARRMGIASGVLLTGLLFGLVHSPQLGGSWAHVAILIFVGVILTTVRAISGTVFASYIVHLTYNTCLFLAFVISTGGLKHLPPGP